MKVLVIGANGQIGTLLVQKLKSAGHEPKAMIRKEKQIAKFEDLGVDTVIADLEKDISHAFLNMDAVVFTAGSGAHTPKAQTKIIDRDGAIKAIEEAKNAGAERFVMVSALKANRDPEVWPESMLHYYKAKSAADEHLRESGLTYTILMPGRLSNEEAEGKVQLSERIESADTESITREDVATVITEMLTEPATYNKSLELLQGEEEIPTAVSNV